MIGFKTSLVAAIGVLATGAATQAHAQSDGGVDFSFNAGAATEYVFRGVSQTDEDPQVFGGVDATIGSQGYLGVWATNVDFGDGTDFEYDIYGGIRPQLGPATLDVGFIYYGYTDQPSGADWDYWEGKVGVSVPAGPATLAANVYYSPDFTGGTGDAWYYEASAAASIPNTKFTVSGGVGHQTIEEAGDYTTWNLGAGFQATDNLGFDVRYYDTDAHEFGKLYDSRFVASVKVTF